MTKKDVADQFYQAMTSLQELVDSNTSEQKEMLVVMNLFLSVIISTTVNLVELDFPGSARLLYANVEAVGKAGGLLAVKTTKSANDSLHSSVSGIEPDDRLMATNYLGKVLSTALVKGMNELPAPLRKPEMGLRGIEAMLANLLNQQFANSHEVLDSLCSHVHHALAELEARPEFLQ